MVITSDHGHTPFWSMDRKAPGRGRGQRFSASQVEGSIELDGAAVPGGPVHCLHRFGAFFGQQHRGFHGGVGLEEMVVPLAFVGRVRAGTGRPVAPGWWWDTGVKIEVEPPLDTWEAEPEPGPSPEPVAAAPAASWLDGVTDPGHRRALMHLQEYGHLTEVEAVRLMGDPRAPRKFARKLEEYVALAPFGIRVEMGSSGKTWKKE